MRLLSFLFALCLVTILALAEVLSSRQPAAISPAPAQPVQNATQSWSGSDSTRMWRRAEIRVLPLDLLAANRAELESLRKRVADAESDSSRLGSSDLAVREQLFRQLQLMKALLRFAERQEADTGKSATALEVQRHLNRIEGQTMCEACHSGIVARIDGVQTQRKQMVSAEKLKLPGSTRSK